MYGPPPDPREIPLAAGWAEVPGAWGLSLAVGGFLVALAAWRRPPEAMRALCFTLGATVLLTAPLLGLLDTAWFGAFPTIDKEGSLLFYLDGVHVRALLHPIASLQDPAVQLIGVHLGHLWPVQLFDSLGLSTPGAFNAVGLLSMALGWWAAWGLAREAGAEPRVALATSLPFGLGLHVLRDLNWYTIEKAGVGWLALWAWMSLRGMKHRRYSLVIAGLTYGIMCWMNLYLGLVAAAMGALVLIGAAVARAPELRRVLAVNVACALFALPLVLAQGLLMREAPTLGTPDQFLWQRAALDSLTLWPARWNRLELGPSLFPPLALVGLWAMGRARQDPAAKVSFGLVTGLTLLALGPALAEGVSNPVYLALARGVPGLWRIAKPEVFFEGAFLALLTWAGLGLSRLGAERRGLTRPGVVAAAALAATVTWWLAVVRPHPVYPGFSEPVESVLKSTWKRKPAQPTP